MKKKRILYSELAPEAPAPRAPATPEAAPAPAAAAARSAKKGGPLDLARALAAARVAEEASARAPVSAPTLAPPAATAPVPSPVASPVITARAPAVAPAPTAARTLRERVRNRAGQLEVLLLKIGDERFGVELAAVEEAIDIPPVHHVPEMPPAMLGVITVRGVLTTVYSPSDALGIALHDGTSALIFRRGRARLGIVVDEVDDVTTLDLSLLRDAPVLDAGDGIVLGVVRQQDTLLTLVDTDALLAACQAAPLLETA